MGDNNPTTSYASSLPPGCRFFPSDEQLISYYLTSKNNRDKTSPSSSSGIDLIQELNLYNFDPFDLPETACFRFGRGGRRRHWYCYVAARALKNRGRRRAGCGFWKRLGRVRDVLGGGQAKVLVGRREKFVFYSADESKAAPFRTSWVMYEYALLHHHKASFVLCRVFFKSNQRNNLSEHVLSSYAEESVATVRHIGVQCDGTVTSPIAEVKPNDDNSADSDKESLAYPVRLISELDGDIASQPIAEQIQSDGDVTLDATFFDTLTTQEITAIAEGDFIELDDILCPLSGID